MIRPEEQLRVDLEAARTVITDPRRWVKGTHARQTDDGMAYRAVGAVDLVVGHDGPRLLAALTALVAADRGHWVATVAGVWQFNDRRATTHADVLDLFDRAIKVTISGVARFDDETGGESCVSQ